MNRESENKGSKEFVSLLVPNQRHIQAFILTLVPNINDAEDIYQEALSEMWNKFDTFKPGTDFVAWGVTIAKYKILSFRKMTHKSRLHFNNDIYEMLEGSVSSKIDSLHNHIDVLKDCVRKLSEKETVLLKMRYESNMTFQKMSTRTGKTPPAIHRIMAGIHSRLALCIRRVLRMEEIA